MVFLEDIPWEQQQGLVSILSLVFLGKEGMVLWGHQVCSPRYDLRFSIKDALSSYRASLGGQALFGLQGKAKPVCLFCIFPVSTRAEPITIGIHTYVYSND